MAAPAPRLGPLLQARERTKGREGTEECGVGNEKGDVREAAGILSVIKCRKGAHDGAATRRTT